MAGSKLLFIKNLFLTEKGISKLNKLLTNLLK